MNTDPLAPTPFPPVAVARKDRTWAMLVHLSAFAGHLFPFAHILAPLVIWLIGRKDSAFVDDQGREAVNAQISVTLYAFGAVVLCFVLFVIPLLGILFVPPLCILLLGGLYVANIVLVIVAGIAADDGKTYRYPFILRLVK